MSERFVRTKHELLASAEIGYDCPVPQAAAVFGGTGNSEDVPDIRLV